MLNLEKKGGNMSVDPQIPPHDPADEPSAVDSQLNEDTDTISPEERRALEQELPSQQGQDIPSPSEDGDADSDLDERETHQHDTR